MKRVISIAFVLIMTTALFGCGGRKRTPIQLTLSTEDSEAILNAAGIRLPDANEAAGAETVVDYFGWDNPYQNYSEDEIINTGYWTFENKYGGTLNYIETDYFSRTDDLSRLIMAGTPPDLTVGGTNSTAMFPMNAIKGMIQSVDDYIDYSDPLWAPMKEVADFFLLGGKHYQIVIYTSPTNVCLYNRRVLTEWGFDDPAELYYNDEWTWDAFYDMCLEFSDVDEDRFALDGYGYADAIATSVGQTILEMDENGVFYSNLDSPEIERAWNLVYDLCKNDCNYRDASGNRWARREEDGSPCGLNQGKLLFYLIPQRFFTYPVEEIQRNYGDISQQEIMFAPLPRDPNGDGNYYLLSEFDDINGCLCLVQSAENPEGAALLASCIRFKIIDPIVRALDRNQLANTYLWSEDMLDMKDECQKIADANPFFDMSGNLNDGLGSVMSDMLWNIPRSSSPNSWAQLKESHAEQFEYYIDELNALIDEYNQ